MVSVTDHPMPTKKRGSPEALEDYFYATNHLLEYAIRLIGAEDSIAKNAFREAACVQLRLLGDFLADIGKDDSQRSRDFRQSRYQAGKTRAYLSDWSNDPLKRQLHKTVAHLSLTRGAKKSISDRALVSGIKTIWPAIQNFQADLQAELRQQFARHIAEQNDAWIRFQTACPHASDDVSDSGGTAGDVIIL